MQNLRQEVVDLQVCRWLNNKFAYKWLIEHENKLDISLMSIKQYVEIDNR